MKPAMRRVGMCVDAANRCIHAYIHQDARINEQQAGTSTNQRLVVARDEAGLR